MGPCIGKIFGDFEIFSDQIFSGEQTFVIHGALIAFVIDVRLKLEKVYIFQDQ